MRGLRLVGVLVLILVGSIGGCEPAPVAIPPGAQQVAVVATTTSVTLRPTEVPAGDVYLVLTFPTQGPGEVWLIQSGSGGLSDAQLAQLAQTGDAGQGIVAESMSASCCGNVVKKTLTAGKYAIILPGPAGSAAVVPPLSTATLVVDP
jgi:hypothetical protein